MRGDEKKKKKTAAYEFLKHLIKYMRHIANVWYLALNIIFSLYAIIILLYVCVSGGGGWGGALF